MFKLRVINGIHRIGAEYGYENGKRFEKSAGRNVGRGEVFESKTDLSKLFPEKFVRVDSVEQASIESSVEDEEYEGMSMEELKKLAEELEIKVPSNISKKNLIGLIKEVAMA